MLGVVAKAASCRNRAGQKTIAQRSPAHEADAQFLAQRQHVGLGATPDHRIFVLDRGKRQNRVRASDSLQARLGEPEMQNLALGDEILDRAGDVFDRHPRVDAVLVEQVNAVGAQAA